MRLGNYILSILLAILFGCKGSLGVSKIVEPKANYQINSRLHDIWALKSIDEKVIGSEQSNAYLEFNLTTEKVYGNTGCNSISGNLIIHADTLILLNLAVTEMLCFNFQNEQEYISLIQLPMVYRIEELELVLKSTRATLIFRKVD